MEKVGKAAAVAIGLPLALLMALIFMMGGEASINAAAAACSTSSVDPSAAASASAATAGMTIDGYGPAQLAYAAQIIAAGKALHLSAHAITIGVATAIGESRLQNLDYGDTAGPDSRGLFQQRASQGWGTVAQEMDPVQAATMFFQHLVRVPGYNSEDPSLAIHSVQGNADPTYYDQFWATATDITSTLAGVTTAAIGGPSTCSASNGSGNDLPWKTQTPDTPSPDGMYARECTDFALWRVNEELGYTDPAHLRYTDQNFRGDGQVLGNAADWLTGWQVKGWPTGTTPQVGAIAWWGANAGVGPNGHVAVVSAINSDGTITVQEYNWTPYTYDTRTIAGTAPTGYLYVPVGGSTTGGAQ